MIKSNLLSSSKQVLKVIGDLGRVERLKVTTDSRKLESFNTFIALHGERFDGYNFIKDLIKEDGLQVYIFEYGDDREEQIKKWHQADTNNTFIMVKSIYDFILEVANISIHDFKERGGKVVGLTGSNGKTTNKEILAYLISGAIGENQVHYTKGNLNNHIGVPLTIFDIEDEHEVAIIEMGTNHPGEIQVLCNAAEPDYGMITNVGHAHIEYLKSLDGVLEEKGALYRSIQASTNKDKCFVLNSYDEKLVTLSKEQWVKDLSHTEISDNSFTIIINGEVVTVNNPSLLGKHQQINMAMGMTLAMNIYKDKKDEIIKAAREFHLKGMNRGEIRELAGKKIYLDAYNANPSSMMASLNTFKSLLEKEGVDLKKALLVLGDMNEIGEQVRELHKLTAERAKELGFEKFVFVGRYAEFYKEGFESGLIYKNVAELRADIVKLMHEIDFTFFKGSRSLQLESILDINKA